MSAAGNDLRKKLIQLQNQTKRDPEAYREEFEAQLRHFDAHIEQITRRPQEPTTEFIPILQYIAQVSGSYPKLTEGVPRVICTLLETKRDALHYEVRREMVKAILLLRNREELEAEMVTALCFNLMRVEDKKLRTLMLSHIVADVKRLHKQKGKEGVHKKLQRVFQKILAQDDTQAARYAQTLLVELFRRKLWTSPNVTNLICRGIGSSHMRIAVPAMRFILGKLQVCKFLTIEQTKSKKQMAKEEAAAHDGIDLEDEDAEEFADMHHQALENLEDPQGLADKLMRTLQKTTEKFEIRLLMMKVISRLIAAHYLYMPTYYTFLERFMEPNVKKITTLLALAAEAVHEESPVEDVQPLVRAIANHFVTDKVGPDAATVGLHTITKMAERNKDVVEKTLLRDLVQYKTERKDKGVTMASRRLLRYYREVDPDRLGKRDRGRPDDLPSRGGSSEGTGTAGNPSDALGVDSSDDEWEIDSEVGSEVSDGGESMDEDEGEEGEGLSDMEDLEEEGSTDGQDGNASDGEGSEAPSKVSLDSKGRVRLEAICAEHLMDGTNAKRIKVKADKLAKMDKSRSERKWTVRKENKGGGMTNSQKEKKKPHILTRTRSKAHSRKGEKASVKRVRKETARKTDQKFKKKRGW